VRLECSDSTSAVQDLGRRASDHLRHLFADESEPGIDPKKFLLLDCRHYKLFTIPRAHFYVYHLMTLPLIQLSVVNPLVE